MLEFGHAGFDSLSNLVRSRGDELEILWQPAVEAEQRAPCSPLIQQQDVTLAQQWLEGTAGLQVQVDGAAARAAVDQQHRVWCGVCRSCRNAGKEKLEVPAVGPGVILGHLKSQAMAKGRGQRFLQQSARRLFRHGLSLSRSGHGKRQNEGENREGTDTNHEDIDTPALLVRGRFHCFEQYRLCFRKFT